MHVAIWKMGGSESLALGVLDLKATTRKLDSEAWVTLGKSSNLCELSFPEVGLIPALPISWDYS